MHVLCTSLTHTSSPPQFFALFVRTQAPCCFQSSVFVKIGLLLFVALDSFIHFLILTHPVLVIACILIPIHLLLLVNEDPILIECLEILVGHFQNVNGSRVFERAVN